MTVFPPPEVRKWQQYRGIDVNSRVRTVSRGCTRCKSFYLVRYKDESELTDEQKRFVTHNQTPCETAHDPRQRR